MNNHTQPRATGRSADPARICIVDGWRELDEHREAVCTHCQTRMEHHLTLLETSAVWLAVVARHEPTASGELNVTALGLAAPARLRLPAGHLDDQAGLPPIGSVLSRWLYDWAGEQADRLSTRFVARRLRGLLRWACTAHDADIITFDEELRGLVSAARRALNRTLQATRYAAPCPRCGEKRLSRDVGSEWIRCGACACLWSESEYATAALESAPDSSQMYAHEVAVLLGIERKTVDQWVWRGRLTPDAFDGKSTSDDPEDQGRPMYTAGQARRVAHEVMLYREQLVEVRLIHFDPGVREYRVIHAAGSILRMPNGYEHLLRRGTIVTVGVSGPDEEIVITEPAPKEIPA